MEHHTITTNDDFGITIYTTTPPNEPSFHPSPAIAATNTDITITTVGVGRKRQAVAKGMQKTLSKTSMLINFLPTGTLLTFEMLLPSVSGKGDCSPVGTMMINALLALCTLSCFFFHFTDSFKGPDGKVYYGFVTPKGLSVFKSGGIEVPKDERYKVGITDFVHAVMSVMVFMAIAFSDHRVRNCVVPGHVEKDMEEVMESFPLMVGIICSALFLVFPTTRYGIGCMPN